MAALIKDFFPARVTLGDQTLTGARALLTDERIFVFVDGPSSIELYAQGEVASYDLGMNPVPITLTDGSVWTAITAGGCGCGSKLKSMDVQAELAKVSV